MWRLGYHPLTKQIPEPVRKKKGNMKFLTLEGEVIRVLESSTKKEITEGQWVPRQEV